MISGPSATFGIMLRLTSSGIISASSGFDQVKASASSTPTTNAESVAAVDLGRRHQALVHQL